MLIIKQTPSENGAFPFPQEWGGIAPPTGYYQLKNNLDMADFYKYNGFVNITTARDVVTSYTPNTEAWESWKKTATPDEPTEAEILNVLLGV